MFHGLKRALQIIVTISLKLLDFRESWYPKGIVYLVFSM